jgi:hypothetical protein
LVENGWQKDFSIMFSSSNNYLSVAIKKTAKEFPVELALVLDISVEELNSWLSSTTTPQKPEVRHKLTKALHLNEKLSDSATGVDATIHQYIDDELKSVINLIK